MSDLILLYPGPGSKPYVSKEDYDRLVNENKKLLKKIEELEKWLELLGGND